MSSPCFLEKLNYKYYKILNCTFLAFLTDVSNGALRFVSVLQTLAAKCFLFSFFIYFHKNAFGIVIFLKRNILVFCFFRQPKRATKCISKCESFIDTVYCYPIFAIKFSSPYSITNLLTFEQNYYVNFIIIAAVFGRNQS